MASAALSAEYALPTMEFEVCPAAQPGSMRTISWPWRAIADAVSGIAFLGVLGWEMWRIGGELFRLGAQMAAAGGGYLF